LHARRTDDGENMKLDPVLAEIRAIREAYSMKFAGDVKAMLADIRARQEKGGRRVVSRPPNRVPVRQETVDVGQQQTSP
jgi:hypothetical protein